MKNVLIKHQHLTRHYLQDQLLVLKETITRYEIELRHHLHTCPFRMAGGETIDVHLKEFVRLHHLDLIRSINYQLNRFRDDLEEKRLAQQLQTYRLTIEQVSEQ